MERLLEILKSLRERWNTLTLQQKLALLVVAVGFPLLIIFGIQYAGRPDFVPLYTSLSPQDAAAVVKKLEAEKVPYELKEEGGIILVPSKQVHKLRINFAAEGLPQTGGIGLEYLDKTDLTATEFTLNKKHLRALQAELVRTITQIQGVESARVHLALPKEELFTEREKEPTASVLLKLAPGTRLGENQVAAIAHLVARGVEGLKPSSVTVVDTLGNILSQEMSETRKPGGLSTTQMEIQKKFEKDLQANIQSMLDSVVGYTPKGLRKAIVRVTANLEFDEKKIQVESFQPAKENVGVVRSQQSLEETYNAVKPQGGVPGTPTNVPGTPPAPPAPTTTTGTPGYPAAGQIPGTYTKKEGVTNYEISSRKEEITTAPGTNLKSLAVGVFVDSSLRDEDLKRIEKVVSAAAGLNPARGDQIQVQSFPFDTEFIERDMAEMERETKWDQYVVLARYAAMGLVALLLLFGLFRLIKVLAQKKEAAEIPIAPELAVPPPLPPEFAPPPMPTPEEFAEMALEKKRGFLESLKRRGEETTALMDEVEQLVHSKPEVAAELIRSWVAER